MRVDLHVLNTATDILNSPKLKAAGLDRDALKRIVAAQEAAKAAAPDFKELLDNILAAEKYADSTGFDKVLSSLQNPALNGAPQIGTNYTLKYLKENGHDIKGIVFEEKVLGGDRIVDMKGFKNDTEIFYEFKSVKDIPPGRFGEQFTKDLINAGGLDNIKWVFDEKKIPNNVLKAHKDALLEDLERSLTKLNARDRERLFNKYGLKGEQISDFLEIINKNFDSIFEVY